MQNLQNLCPILHLCQESGDPGLALNENKRALLKIPIPNGEDFCHRLSLILVNQIHFLVP